MFRKYIKTGLAPLKKCRQHCNKKIMGLIYHHPLFKTWGSDSTGSCQVHALIDISILLRRNITYIMDYPKSEEILNSVHNRNSNRHMNEHLFVIILVHFGIFKLL